ncbi:hypothetical protein O181_040423 [Austropuccinia psidii MF-1]|uniref:Uncharacterized protein n=1 Tax=Austropuccinia psidii MF-1 TaxID=1389203 RepID=A0A9Q3HCU9_9BASI|nr:hypothetical protein [Austropuccinia psidii MF-1]
MKMVHTRNGSSYSVQPDGSGQGRGKTRDRSNKSSSRKTCLEDARVPPIPQGEDHRTLRRVEPSVLQRQGQKDKELVEEPKYFIYRPEEGVGNDPRFGERRPSGVDQLQTNSRNVQRQAQGTSEEAERSQELSRQGQRKRELAQTLLTKVQDPQVGTISSGQCFQYGQNSYGIHRNRAGKDEQEFSMQIIDEIKFVKSSIDVEIGKFDAKLNKITSDINELKKDDRISSDGHKLTMTKIDLTSNACDRIVSRYQVQIDEIEDLSISNINDQLKIMKNHALEIVYNTNIFATHLERSESERQKLKDVIIAHVEQIYKNYEPNSHMPRHSTPLTEEKLSVKGSLTPFLG